MAQGKALVKDEVILVSDIISRKDAKAQGIERFFTGKICKHGHVDFRRTSNGACLTCERVQGKTRVDANPEKYKEYRSQWAKDNRELVNGYSQKWRDAHPEEAKAADKKWRDANPEKVKEKQRQYYIAHQEQEKEYTRNWILNNRERHRQNQKNWFEANREKELKRISDYAKANPEKTRAYNSKRRARKINAEGHYNSTDVQRIGNLQKWKCAWCSKPCKNDYHVDHYIPLSKGGSNWPSNLCISCPKCNNSKHASDPLDFARRLGRLL